MKSLDLDRLNDDALNNSIKGFNEDDCYTMQDFPAIGQSLFSEVTPFPIAVLKQSVLEKNRKWMREFAADQGIHFAPHGKTSMAPQLFQMQVEDGAFAITAATVEQLMVYRRFGVSSVLFANQLVGRQHINYVASELEKDPSFEFWCLVDTADSVEHLARLLRQKKTPVKLNVLLEIGMIGGRCGVRDDEQLKETIKALHDAQDALILCGVETFEGAAPGANDEEIDANVEKLFDRFEAAAYLSDASGLFGGDEIILTAGGTSHLDVATRRLKTLKLSKPTKLIVRSGCYLTMDDVFYKLEASRANARSNPANFSLNKQSAALEVVGYVQSQPEPNLSILGFGKRDLSHDMHLPVTKWFVRPSEGVQLQELDGGHEITTLNDQHAYLHHSEGSPLMTGDLVGVGISHPCTTFDKWRLLYLVDDDYRITGAVRTFF